MQQQPLAHTITESEQILGLGRTGIYSEIGAGRLIAFKVGRKTLIARSELERFIAERLAEAQTPAAREAARIAGEEAARRLVEGRKRKQEERKQQQQQLAA